MIGSRVITALAVAAVTLAGCAGSAATPTTGAGSIKITYEEQGQIELTRANGTRILIDVWNPSALSKPPTASDILLLTHSEREDTTFQASFPGQKLIATAGQLTANGVRVTSVEGSHSDAAVATGHATNHMLVVEVDGLRIVDMGEEGEITLSATQVAAIGTPDIALCALTNVGGLDPSGRKAIDIIGQIKPKLIVASFADIRTAFSLTKLWKVTFTTKMAISMSRTALPAETTLLFMGDQASSYGTLLKLTESNW